MTNDRQLYSVDNVEVSEPSSVDNKLAWQTQFTTAQFPILDPQHQRKKEEKIKAPFRPPRHPPGPADRSQTPRPGQDHHHSLDQHADAPKSTRVGRGGSPNGFTLGHRGHSSHQQG
ncbi:uncharacterized protein N7496_007589 [Penicillium cataractarum]|uniref:Uncharacterized protein n=1 Tax=Penicillium cataractarum TaxID=2100454 RepID=A0A9W9S3Q3_9EURO|nr:uncharacterized protein N7496_007589 [Penicillium cataractarum]KAJ5371497.1 hypothetical protein N7496_007589 [Penicillium cataractarum]